MATPKPTHVSSAPVIATVRITAYWGSLTRDSVTCGGHDSIHQLNRLVKSRAKADPTPERVSFLVEMRQYNRTKDAYCAWKPAARYNHLGLEIAL